MTWIRRHRTMLCAIGASMVTWIVVFAWRLDRELSPLGQWREELRDYARRDATNPPPSNAILFVGSSSIRLWESIRQDFPRYRVFRRGLNGARLEDTRALADRLILPYEPSMVILYGGDNDLAEGHTPIRVLREFQRLVRRIHEALPETTVGLLSVKPSPSRWHLIRRIRETNRRLREWCESDDRLVFIDVHTGMVDEKGQPRIRLFQPDGLHLNRTGYTHWADMIRPHLPPVARRTNLAGAPVAARLAHDPSLPDSRPPRDR